MVQSLRTGDEKFVQ